MAPAAAISETSAAAALAFAELAREYVALVDAAATTTAHSFLTACARVLPRLYVAGISLPDVDPGDSSEAYPRLPVASPMGALCNLLGERSLYREVFDPVFDKQAMDAMLPDDLADIYIDIVRPLAAFDSGNLIEALWSWKFNMVGHCGDHLVDALRPIHRLVHDHMPEDWVATRRGAG